MVSQYIYNISWESTKFTKENAKEILKTSSVAEVAPLKLYTVSKVDYSNEKSSCYLSIKNPEHRCSQWYFFDDVISFITDSASILENMGKCAAKYFTSNKTNPTEIENIIADFFEYTKQTLPYMYFFSEELLVEEVFAIYMNTTFTDLTKDEFKGIDDEFLNNKFSKLKDFLMPLLNCCHRISDPERIFINLRSEYTDKLLSTLIIDQNMFYLPTEKLKLAIDFLVFSSQFIAKYSNALSVFNTREKIFFSLKFFCFDLTDEFNNYCVNGNTVFWSNELMQYLSDNIRELNKTDKFKEKGKIHTLIKSFKALYKQENIIERYKLTHPTQYFIYVLEKLVDNKLSIQFCKNCNRHFLSTRAGVEYCSRPYANNGKTCKEVGPELQQRLNRSLSRNTYHTLYVRVKTRIDRRKREYFIIYNKEESALTETDKKGPIWKYVYTTEEKLKCWADECKTYLKQLDDGEIEEEKCNKLIEKSFVQNGLDIEKK